MAPKAALPPKGSSKNVISYQIEAQEIHQKVPTKNPQGTEGNDGSHDPRVKDTGTKPFAQQPYQRTEGPNKERDP